MSTPTSTCTASQDALPGLFPDSSGNSSSSSLRPDGSGMAGAIKDTKVSADEMGNINVKIYGPVLKSAGTDYKFSIYITKEDARNKWTIASATSNILDDSSSDSSVDSVEANGSTVIVYKVTNIYNTLYEDYWVHIQPETLMLARGTYILYAYLENSSVPTASDSDSTDDILVPGKTQVAKFALTIYTDPVQGKAINCQYLKTAYRSLL